ncbi:MAG: hypothetical protein ACRC5A_02335 [Enterobacteriaceae bacterium]
MNNPFTHCGISLSLCFILSLAATQVCASTNKKIDLLPLVDGSTERATGMSQSLQMVITGASDSPGSSKTHAVRWFLSPDVTQIYADDLGIPEGYSSAVATAISPLYGKIVGVATRDITVNTPAPNNTCNQAFYWNDTLAVALPMPAGATCSDAIAVSDQGDIAGTIRTKDDKTHAYLWQLAGNKGIDLNRPDWDQSTTTAVIRPYGQQTPWVIGSAKLTDGRAVAFVWHNNEVHTLPDNNMENTLPLAINYTGTAVGCATNGQQLQAFAWNPLKNSLSSLPGMSCATAISYRILNTYAGFTVDGNHQRHAYGTADFAGPYNEASPSYAVAITDYPIPERGYYLLINNDASTHSFVMDVGY